MFRPPLAQVLSSLSRVQTRQLATLPHVVDTVSSYLDPSPLFSLVHAAATRSPRLFQRVVDANQSTSEEEPQRHHRFACAMEVAIQNDDLTMVQKIHEIYPEPLNLRALALAFQFGSLEMVQWVVQNRHDRVCSPPGIENLCRRCLCEVLKSIDTQDVVRVVEWLASIDLKLVAESGALHQDWITLMKRSVPLAQWAQQNNYLTEVTAGKVLRGIIEKGPLESIAVFEYLVEQGFLLISKETIRSLLRGCCQPELEPLVDVVLGSRLCDSFRGRFTWERTRKDGHKVLQLDFASIYGSGHMQARLLEQLALDAANYCHVDLLRWLYDDCGVAPDVSRSYCFISEERDLLDMYEWFALSKRNWWIPLDATAAASRGSLSAIEWLHLNSPQVLNTTTMDKAAASGHLHIIQWLHMNRNEGCTKSAMNQAAASGHLEVVLWLAQNRTEGRVNEAIVYATMSGHVEIVQWLVENYHASCAVCVLRASLLQASVYSPYLEESALDALRFLDAGGPRADGCVGVCVRASIYNPYTLGALALAQGDLLLADYLRIHHRNELTMRRPQDLVHFGRTGHVGSILWIRQHFPEFGNQLPLR